MPSIRTPRRPPPRAARDRRVRARTPIPRAWILSLAALLIVPFALTGANLVAESKAQLHAATAGPNDVKPLDCSSIQLTSLYKGAGDVTGGSANDLILGASGDQALAGDAGDDCILGGGGNDALQGGAGTGDVCIGGPGEDTFAGCETTIQGDSS